MTADDTSAPVATSGHIVRGVAWGTVSRAAQLGSGLLTTLFLARLLAADDFGLVSMSAIFLSVCSAFADFGIRAYLVQRRSLTHEEIHTATSASWLIGLAIFTVGILAAWPLASFYHAPKLSYIVIAQSGAYLLLNAGAVPSALLARRLDYRRISIAEACSSLTYPATAIPLAYFGCHSWSIVIGRLAQAGVGLALVAPSVHSLVPGRVSGSALQRLLRFGGLVVIASALTQLDENLDNICVGHYFGSAALGTYSLAYNVATIPQKYAAFMIAAIAFPALSASRVSGSFADAAARFTKYQVLVPVFLSLMVGVYAQEACALLIGNRWGDAWKITGIMSLSGAALSVATVVGGTLLAGGRPGVLLLFHAAKAFVTLCFLNAFRVRGVSGVALGFALANCLMLMAGLALAGRCTSTTWTALPRAIARPLLAVLTGVGASYLFRTLLVERGFGTFPVLTISGGAGVLCYLVVALAVSRSELTDVASAIRAAVRVSS